MARKRWVHKVGGHGARVVVEERTWGGPVRLRAFSKERNTNVRRSLKFCVRDVEGKLIPEAIARAKAAAAALADKKIKGQSIVETDTTLRTLLRRFRQDRVPTMGTRHKVSVQRELALLEAVIGASTVVATLDETTWNRIARLRASGEIGARGVRVVNPADRSPVRARSVQITMKTLGQLTRWGSRVKKTGSTQPLLSSDPFSHLTADGEKNPHRPMLTDDEFEAMLEAAPTIHEYMRMLIMLSGETGRRIGSICALRTSDLLWDQGRYGEILWRSEHDKREVRWIAPMTPTLCAELEQFVRDRGLIADARLFRAPKGDDHLTVDRASKWWRKCEAKAEVPRRKGQGYHSLRRRWATGRKGYSLTDVAAAGGWKSTQILAGVYMMPDRDTMEAIAVGAAPVRRTAN